MALLHYIYSKCASTDFTSIYVSSAEALATTTAESEKEGIGWKNKQQQRNFSSWWARSYYSVDYESRYIRIVGNKAVALNFPVIY